MTYIERLENNIYYQPKKIIVRLSNKEMGIGVFATSDIEEGELIERCPMIQMDWKSRYHLDPQISRYLYTNSNCTCKDCQMHGYQLFMVLGYGMIYNHQDTPNTKWTFNFKNLIADVTATKKINENDEIFVNYGPKYFKNREKYSV
jgi:SET domain-containing protein